MATLAVTGAGQSPENIENSAAILAHGAVIDYFMML